MSASNAQAVMRSIAQALGVKANEVRVITHHMGGGFGAKLGGID